MPPPKNSSGSLFQASWGGLETRGGFEGRTYEVEEVDVRLGSGCCPCEGLKCNLSAQGIKVIAQSGPLVIFDRQFLDYP